MTDLDKTRDQLIKQLDDMRKRVAELEHEALEPNWARDIINAQFIMDETSPDSSEDMPCSDAITGMTEDFFRSMTNNLPGAVYQFYVRPHGEMGIYFVGERAFDLLGIECDIEQLFPRVLDAVVPEDREPLLESISEAARAFSRWEHEARFTRPDGEIVFIRGTSQPRRNGDEIIFDGVLMDVTKQRSAEQALRVSEAKFRRLHETMRDAFVIVDMEGQILECNEAYLEMLGYDEHEIKKLTYQELTPEKWHEHEADILKRQIIPRGFSDVYEKEYTRRDGSVFPVELRTVLFRDERGKPEFMWAIVRDITERRRFEESLKQAVAYNRSLIEASLDPLVTIGRDGKITDVNIATELATGYQREELIGKDFSEYFTDPVKASTIYRQVYQQGLVRDCELELRHRDGHVAPVLYNASTYIDSKGQAAGVFASARDISERKRFEEALRDSEVKYRFLAERINDIVWIADMDFRLTYDSPSVEKILGFTLQERMQQSAGQMLTPESYAKILEVLGEELERDKAEGVDPDRSIKLELEYYHKNGSTVWMECIASAIRDNAGKPIGIYGVSRDISDRKKIEEELKRHKDQLECIVRERTSELSLAYDQLKGENDARRASEEALKAREVELEKGRRELLEMNSALKVLLKQREEDKASIEMNILSNLKTSVMPYLEKLEDSGLQENQIRLLSMLSSLLGEIVSPFIRNVSSEYLGLTPSEIQVASLIKEGKSSKEISKILNISLNTVHTYRYKIRIKTGLKNNKVNLRSYLQTMA